MSIKLYDGFRIHSDRIGTLMRILNEVRASIKEKSETAYDAMIEAVAPGALNDQNLYINGWTLISSVRDKIKKDKGILPPNLSTDFTVYLYPGPDRITYGNVFTTHPDWTEMLMNHPDVEPYPYFNNTDRPSNISEYDWNQRYEDWKPFLDLTPVTDSFVIELVDPQGPTPLFLRRK